LVQAGEEKVLQAVRKFRAEGDTYENILNFMRIGKELWKADAMSVLQRHGLSTNGCRCQQ